jgi:predicted acetyltransferase
MTGYEIAAPEPAEHDEILAVLGQSLGFPLERARDWLRHLGADRLRVARASTRVAGVYGVIPMGMWFGGRAVSTGGVTAVAVSPEDRSRGVGSLMMRHSLAAMRRDGHALAALFPATFPIYRRAGYETAGTRIAYRLHLRQLEIAGGEPLSVERFGPAHEAAVHACYERRARATAGNLARTPFLWSRVVAPINANVHAYVIAGDEVEGFVAFSQKDIAVNPRYELTVRDLIALTPRAGRRILHLLADHRSMADHAIVYAAPGEPLLQLVGEEPAQVADQLRWMVRVLDVPAALAARGYGACVRGEVVLDVRDDLVPENHGAFALAVEGGRAEVRRITGAARAVAIDVRALAALYTGYLSAEALVARGGISGEPDDLARLSSLFAGPAPWMPEIF